MQPISKELTRKYFADQPHFKIRGKKINKNEMIDVNMKNIANGFSMVGMPFAAASTNAIDVRLKIKGMIAPIEHKLLGFAKAGFIKSRFFKYYLTMVRFHCAIVVASRISNPASLGWQAAKSY
jgi:hypothetical protein